MYYGIKKSLIFVKFYRKDIILKIMLDFIVDVYIINL